MNEKVNCHGKSPEEVAMDLYIEFLRANPETTKNIGRDFKQYLLHYAKTLKCVKAPRDYIAHFKPDNK